MKRIITLQDISCVGRCSITVALPVISAMGVECGILPTAVLSTHTMFKTFTVKDLSDQIEPISDAWETEGITFDGIYTGYLASGDQCRQVCEFFDRFGRTDNLVLVDPAMADNGSLYAVFDNEYYKKMLSLVKLADILMPNFTEGKMLSGIKEDLLPTKESAVSILKNLKKQGFEKVVLSGISDKDKCGTATLYNGEITFQFNKRFDLNIHGAGDVLSGVFLATLLKGEDFCASVQKAVDFVHDCIDVTVKEGHNLKYGLVIERFLSYL